MYATAAKLQYRTTGNSRDQKYHVIRNTRELQIITQTCILHVEIQMHMPASADLHYILMHI